MWILATCVGVYHLQDLTHLADRLAFSPACHLWLYHLWLSLTFDLKLEEWPDCWTVSVRKVSPPPSFGRSRVTPEYHRYIKKRCLFNPCLDYIFLYLVVCSLLFYLPTVTVTTKLKLVWCCFGRALLVKYKWFHCQWKFSYFKYFGWLCIPLRKFAVARLFAKIASARRQRSDFAVFESSCLLLLPI